MLRDLERLERLRAIRNQKTHKDWEKFWNSEWFGKVYYVSFTSEFTRLSKAKEEPTN